MRNAFLLFTCALALSSTNALADGTLSFAPQANAPTLSILSLQNVRVVPGFPQTTTTAVLNAFPLSSPPISGFVPQVVYGVTNERDPDIDSIPSSSPGGTQLPGPALYRVATLDSGAQAHIINYNDTNFFNLSGAGLSGSYEVATVGANGSETLRVTDPLGIYATGFGNATVSGGAINASTTSFRGHYNMSVTTSEEGSTLPSVIGAPMLASYRANIYNSQPKHLTLDNQTYRSPNVTFEDPSGSIPAGYSKLNLTKVPAPFFGLEPFGTPPQYVPDFEHGSNHPSGPSGWYSLMAAVNATHTAGSFSNQQFIFDTGAQVTVISEALAASLGYYTGGPEPSTPDFHVEVSGVGGVGTMVPGFYLNSLTVPMANAPAITWSHVPVLVLNLPDPAGVSDSVAGVLGMNLFTDRDLLINGIFPAASGGTNTFAGISVPWQWNLTSGGSWSSASNWTLALPDGIDTQANFYGKITSAQTITVNSDVTVGTINFDNLNRYTLAGPGRITLQVSVDQAEIGVSNGTHTISAPMTLASDTNITTWLPSTKLQITSDVSAGTFAITKGGLGVLEMKNVRAGTLTINGGTLVITPNGTSAATSRITGLVIDTGSLSTARIDLSNNSMIIDYSGATPIATIRDYLKRGYAAGSWNGVAGIDSSAGDLMVHAVGVADNAVLGLTTFNGMNITANDILIKFTYYGDANLDGMVNAKDLGMLASHWQQSNSTWSSGDFNYDGKVDIKDLLLFAVNWQHGVGAPLGADLSQALASLGLPEMTVPEPGLVFLVTAFFLTSVSLRSMRRRVERL